MDSAGKADEMRLREHELSNKHQLEGAKLGVEIQKHRQSQHLEGAKLGVEIASKHQDARHERAGMAIDALKHVATIEHQREQSKDQQPSEE